MLKSLPQQYGVLVFLTEDEKEWEDESKSPGTQTALLALHGKGARLVSYSLGEYDALADLLFCLADDEGVSDAIKADIAVVLRPFIERGWNADPQPGTAAE